MRNAAFVGVVCICLLVQLSCQSPRPQPTTGQEAAVASFAWPQGERAAVSLTFDDARASQLDAGIPILNEYGVKATFYVSTDSVVKRLDGWKAVVAAGHEIGNHSMRHACSGNFPWSRQKALEDYTLAQMAAELDEASAKVESLLSVRPLTFAYPCGQKYVGRGERTRSYVPLVAQRFLAGRGWRDESANDPAFCDPARLMAIEFDGLTFEQLKVLVDETAKNGFWLVLCGHDIGPGGRQTTRVDTLRAFCQYARDPANGLWIDTVANVARYVRDQQAARNY
ncbi:MAG: polysaccharide deacetylase family protein [Sedimentisphaerales bacterium]|nr:polysaccharide deacetylase family protein [Sedimentisphaerales bacterium]